jgi:hypothetical protein
MAVTPRHHYHIMKHTWSFCNFLEIQSIMCLPCRLERLKSGMAVTPRHHYHIMKHTWSFCNFLEIESRAYTSPQMVLSNRSMVFISLPKAFEFAFSSSYL